MRAIWQFRWKPPRARQRNRGTHCGTRVLLLHGLLHLRGMGHEADTGEMAEREAELRRQLRLPVGLIARADGTELKQSAGAKRIRRPRAAIMRRARP